MAEKLIVRQNNRFEIEFLAPDPHQPESEQLVPVEHLHALTPFGMLLASLGSCTTIVVHTYAQNHQVDLQEVELHLQYERQPVNDGKGDPGHAEWVSEEIIFRGDLAEEQQERLLKVAHHCAIQLILQEGIEVRSTLHQST